MQMYYVFAKYKKKFAHFKTFAQTFSVFYCSFCSSCPILCEEYNCKMAAMSNTMTHLL